MKMVSGIFSTDHENEQNVHSKEPISVKEKANPMKLPPNYHIGRFVSVILNNEVSKICSSHPSTPFSPSELIPLPQRTPRSPTPPQDHLPHRTTSPTGPPPPQDHLPHRTTSTTGPHLFPQDFNFQNKFKNVPK